MAESRSESSRKGDGFGPRLLRPGLARLAPGFHALRHAQQHPGAVARERDSVPGESPFPFTPKGYRARVRVTQLAPGFRTREIFLAKLSAP
jgi:hypothetical protein